MVSASRCTGASRACAAATSRPMPDSVLPAPVLVARIVMGASKSTVPAVTCTVQRTPAQHLRPKLYRVKVSSPTELPWHSQLIPEVSLSFLVLSSVVCAAILKRRRKTNSPLSLSATLLTPSQREELSLTEDCAIACAPSDLLMRADSPVSMLSSRLQRPSTISPSTGTRSPGSTRSTSPCRMLDVGTPTTSSALWDSAALLAGSMTSLLSAGMSFARVRKSAAHQATLNLHLIEMGSMAEVPVPPAKAALALPACGAALEQQSQSGQQYIMQHQ